MIPIARLENAKSKSQSAILAMVAILRTAPATMLAIHVNSTLIMDTGAAARSGTTLSHVS